MTATEFLARLCLASFGMVRAVYHLDSWVFELRFYGERGWDFSQPDGVWMFAGKSGAGRPLTPRERIVLGHPLQIVAGLVFGLGGVFAPLTHAASPTQAASPSILVFRTPCKADCPSGRKCFATADSPFAESA